MYFHKVFRYSFVSLLSFFTFISCNTTKKLCFLSDYPVYVTNSCKVFPLCPENITQNIDCVQSFNGQFGDKSFFTLLYITGDKNGFDITIQNDLGFTIGSLVFSLNNISLKSSFLPDGLKAQYIIMDMQNVYYNADSLRNLYSTAGLLFEQIVNEDGSIKRRILQNDKNFKKIIEEIDIGSNDIIINNYYRNYKYILSSI